MNPNWNFAPLTENEALIFEEEKRALLQLAYQLSSKIKLLFGECALWYMANSIWRTIDSISPERKA